MELSLIHLAMLVPPLLLIEGFFSGSEIALLSVDKLALKSLAASKNRGTRRARMALELVTHPERILSATLLMTSLCVVSISSLITLYLIGRGVRHNELVGIALTSPLVVIFGELLPKTVYQRYAQQLAPWVAPPVNLIYWLFYPVTRFLSGYTARLSRMLGPIEELLTGKKRTTREELITMLSFGKKESEIKASEKRMIRRILDFKDTEAKHALIPLVQVDAIEESATLNEALERFKKHRHSRMPVYSERIDNIVGVLELADLAGMKAPDHPIRGVIAPAHYVAETQALKDLLVDMRTEDTEMAVVVDEYGGAIGILTFEDIIEEIVGEINDEYDPERIPYRQITEDEWLVKARAEVQLINESLKLDLPEGDYDTVAGFLLQQFGRIPQSGDELFFDTREGTLKFTIRQANERQIETVLIQKLGNPSPS